jgi:hypothetical protein
MRRFFSLEKHGAFHWPLKHRPTKIWAFKHCPPPYALAKKGSMSCSQLPWCPYCWARTHAAGSADNLRQALYYDEALRECVGHRLGPDGRPVLKVHLLEVVATHEFLGTTDIACLASFLRRHLSIYARHVVNPLWPRRVKRFPGSGAIVLWSTEPYQTAADSHVWRLKERIIATIAEDAPDPPKQMPECDDGLVKRVIRRHEEVSRKLIARTVGRVFRYPAGLLRGDAALVAKLLSGFHHEGHLHTRSTFGCLRHGGRRGAD